MKHFKTILSLLFVAVLLTGIFPASPAFAQTSGLFYTVQNGDNLSEISQVFHTTTSRILRLNYLPDPDTLTPGRRLYIPGFEDLNGEIVRSKLPYGESAHTLSRSLHQGDNLITRLNYLTNPDSLYLGQSFFSLKADDIQQTRLSLPSGLNSLEVAVSMDANPWLVAEYNELRAPWQLVRNDTVFLPGFQSTTLANSLPWFSNVEVSPYPLLQGKTTVLKAQSSASAALSGSLAGYPLHFFPAQNSGQVALQGIPRLEDPGLTPLVITASTPDGNSWSFQQNILLNREDYGVDTPLQVADNLVDPAITEPEFNLLLDLTRDAPPEKLWDDTFQSPSPTPDCLTSTYGRLRSYNGSPFTYFHSGLDFCGSELTPVFAPAPGVVVYTGSLEVRGNATIISHGWGVYTGYWHQSRIDVAIGERVEAGQKIGMVGDTGRVNGPHLHFDLIVGSVEVDPDDWLNGLYADL